MTVDLGWRLDDPFAGSAGLLINGVQYLATGTTPVQGNWSTYTATYTGLSADVGDTITIQLNATGDQGNFDNVALVDSLNTVSEPETMFLMGLGILGATLYSKRKRAA